MTINRRQFLSASFAALGIMAYQAACRSSKDMSELIKSVIPAHRLLTDPDENGICLPLGFKSRLVAESGKRPLFSSSYIWHGAPDGGATFPTEDGGWIYVSNSELKRKKGGVGALRFDAQANLSKAYSILEGTSNNCAGGATPWGTWLSCEEFSRGRVWECDPYGIKKAEVRPALGVFEHEAVAVDLSTGILYLTEDDPNGCLYRFIPSRFIKGKIPSLAEGHLEVMIVDKNQRVAWKKITDPLAEKTVLRKQVEEAKHFDGGEGIWFYQKKVYFTTKGDDRVWLYDLIQEKLFIYYDPSNYEKAELTGVDNITFSPSGELLVAEDGGDMQIVAITKNKILVPIVQIVNQEDSEITGPAFSPDGKRLYFSSQRGKTGENEGGLTYEVSGEFA